MGSAARLERAEIPRTRNAHPASPPPLPPPSKHLKSSMKTIARSGALRATAGGVLVVLLLLGSSTKTALAFSSESEGAVEVKKVEVSTAADLAQVAKDISPDGKLKGIDLNKRRRPHRPHASRGAQVRLRPVHLGHRQARVPRRFGEPRERGPLARHRGQREAQERVPSKAVECRNEPDDRR